MTGVIITILTMITLVHLLITFGLVRRLRAHTDLLNQLTDNTKHTLPTGTPIPAFTAHTTDGDSITQYSLRHPAAIALLAVDCPHCRTNLPDLAAYLHGAGYPRDHVLAVVTSHDTTDPTARHDMIDTLIPLATVISEDSTTGTLTTAFNTQAFPTFYLTDPHATITAATHTVRDLPNTPPPITTPTPPGPTKPARTHSSP